ncbi:MAG: DUF4837 family protein [Bacteroidales bacterium]|nr:DUF4837 family protein [Bacteroidales bacterium]
MKRLSLILAAVLLLAGCKGSRTLLPNVSGKAGEVIVVLDKANWEGDLGNDVRELLASDCPYLPQKEPLYNLVNVIPSGFTDLFRVHRNIFIFNIDPQLTSTGMNYQSDVWSSPQCVVQLSARDAAEADSLLMMNKANIMSVIEQAERDRIIRNSILYEEAGLAPQVKEIFGGSPHFPSGYKLRKKTSDFVWIADVKQYITQGILIYKYPVDSKDPLSLQEIISHRNSTMMVNVPGMFENTYMTTGEYMPPTVEYIKFRGREFAQTRGLWEVVNDYMGGPFVSHSFYSPDGKDIIVAEGFVYAPRFDKRHYLRQVESILYSWEWAEK